MLPLISDHTQHHQHTLKMSAFNLYKMENEKRPCLQSSYFNTLNMTKAATLDYKWITISFNITKKKYIRV